MTGDWPPKRVVGTPLLTADDPIRWTPLTWGETLTETGHHHFPAPSDYYGGQYRAGSIHAEVWGDCAADLGPEPVWWWNVYQWHTKGGTDVSITVAGGQCATAKAAKRAATRVMRKRLTDPLYVT